MRRRHLIIPIILMALCSYPAAAEVQTTWSTTYPTEAPPYAGIQWELNVDGGGWAIMLDDPDPSDLEYPFVQHVGTVIQCRARAWNWRLEPVYDGDLVIGVNQIMQWGERSPISFPNVIDDGLPGGCSAPTCQVQ